MLSAAFALRKDFGIASLVQNERCGENFIESTSRHDRACLGEQAAIALTGKSSNDVGRNVLLSALYRHAANLRHIVEDRHKRFSLFGELNGAVAVNDSGGVCLFVLTDCAEQDDRSRTEVAFERFDILVVDKSQIFFLDVGVVDSGICDDDAVLFSDRDVTALQIFLFREHFRVFVDVCNNQFVHINLLNVPHKHTRHLLLLYRYYIKRIEKSKFNFALCFA